MPRDRPVQTFGLFPLREDHYWDYDQNIFGTAASVPEQSDRLIDLAQAKASA